MAGESNIDPSAQFSEWVTQWERNFNEFSNQLMGTDEFSKSLNQMQTMQLEFQRNFSETMAKQLANYNMPSRDDIISIREDLVAVEKRLGAIERSLAALATGNVGAQKKKGPARTRKPPSTNEE